MDLKIAQKYTKDLTILYVEDDSNISKHVYSILQMLFKTVTLHTNAKEALNTYKLGKNSFDIILTDLYLPETSGLEMIEEILILNPKQHISIFSGQDNAIMLKKLINLGIDSFLLKPLQEKHLIHTLRKVSKNIFNEKIIENSNILLEQKIQDIASELKNSLLTDNLTGLKNRTALIKDIEKHNFTMLALVDIDHLMFINNLYGSDIGNQIIKKFANLLENEFKNSNFSLYQTSADEFAVCSNDEDSIEFENSIKNLSSKITNLLLYIDEIEDDISIDATIGVTYELNFLASCGIIYESHLLLAQANTALKHAKAHKAPLVSYDESLNSLQDIQNIMQWKEKIKIAYTENNIVPVFQPIVDKNGTILKYETLMRLKEVEGDKVKLISPFFFLDISILTKQYAKLSMSIINQALEHLKNNKDITLSINLTFSDIQNPKMTSFIVESIKKYDIGSRLIIEIVESEDIKDYQLLVDFIQEVKKYSVQIAIDDFGSGFSNFENIIKFKADYIKIDGSLIKKIDTDKTSLAIVKAIVQFAHTLDIKIIAEYVHSKEVLVVLEELNIDEYQGFYFYEPALEFIDESVKA